MALLSFENITIGYDNHPIVENLNFEIEQGDYLTVLGENGAGKSTLLKTMLGLIKPLSGRIVAIADIFDAMKSERTYKRALTQGETIEYALII